MKIDNEFAVSVPIGCRAVIDAKPRDPRGVGEGRPAASETSDGNSPPLHAVRTKGTPKPEALDLMGLAGGAVYKRLIPVGIGAAASVAVIFCRRVR
jgi:hypothetical protein